MAFQPSKRVELVKIGELLEHEDIERRRLIEVVESIKRLGYILKPIIVDEKTLVIIDGHHRYNALKILGAKYIPVIYADYNKDIIKVTPGKAIITIPLSHPEKITDYLYFLIKSTIKRGPDNIRIKIINNNTITNTKIRIDLSDLYLNMRNLLKNIYNDAHDKYNRQTRKTKIILTLPLIEKRNIEATASQEEKLPPKTSYHITPLKKIRKPIKLSILQ